MHKKIVLLFSIMVGFLVINTAQAEVFSVDDSIFKNSPNIIYRDTVIEKDLELEYLGIYETISPTNYLDLDKEYRFVARMKTYLGKIISEKQIKIPESSYRATGVDINAYDRESGKWQEFSDLQFIVLTTTTGTTANVRVTGAGVAFEPKIEPFASGADQQDDYIKIKIKAEYLPPNTPATLSSSILKRVKTSSEVVTIGNFQMEGVTDSSGFIEREKEFYTKEYFDNLHGDTYSVTAAASHYFQFENSAITEQRTKVSDLVKQISVADFDLRKVSSEFYDDRAYLTFNGKIKNIYDETLTRLEPKTDKPRLRYGDSEKIYDPAHGIFVLIKNIGINTVSYEVEIGDYKEKLDIAPSNPLEIFWSGRYRNISVNGENKFLKNPAAKAKLYVSGATPRISLFDVSDKVVFEGVARDLKVSFDELTDIPHKTAITSGGEIDISYNVSPLSSLRWSASLENDRRPGEKKTFIISGDAIDSGSHIVSVAPTDIISLQMRLIELLQQLASLLSIKLRLGI